MSLFEVYDPFTFWLNTSLNWLVLFMAAVCGFYGYWGFGWGIGSSLSLALAFISSEFSGFSRYLKIKSGLLIAVSLFFYILVVNILGLIPFVFTCSAHFVFSFSFAFPFWAGLMLLGWLNFTNSMFVHLIPLGTPTPLMCFMAVIETVSGLIRPWSLSVRLMANLISGHLLMSLLGECGLGLLPIQSFLLSFEFFVCFIQAYVFSSLLTMYSGEI